MCIKAGGAKDSWKIRIWIIQQKVTSHPVSTTLRSSFHKAKKWRFDWGGFSAICKPSGSFSFKLRAERCSRHISSTFYGKLSVKENSFKLFWRKTMESLLSSNGGFCTFVKQVLFRLLILVVRDSVITLSDIAYNVSNNLDEVLPAIVCHVYHGNVFNRSRFFSESGCQLTQLKLCIHVRLEEKTSWIVYSRLVSYFRISFWILLSL